MQTRPCSPPIHRLEYSDHGIRSEPRHDVMCMSAVERRESTRVSQMELRIGVQQEDSSASLIRGGGNSHLSPRRYSHTARWGPSLIIKGARILGTQSRRQIRIQLQRPRETSEFRLVGKSCDFR